MNATLQGTMGLLVAEAKGPLPFSESTFARKLCLASRRHGLNLVVFTPSGITESEGIKGYTYQKGSWSTGSFPDPDLIYDWCFCKGTQTAEKRQKLALLAERKKYRFLTRGLPGKWAVYEAMKQSEHLAPYLPETSRFQSVQQLSHRMSAWQDEAFMKPLFGTHGKKTLHFIRTAKGIQLTGRTAGNHLFTHHFDSLQSVHSFLASFCRGRPFLLQPYLHLSTRSGNPFDVRVLMQKGADGRWSRTGMAARVGEKEALTSNLHGGGRAFSASAFLNGELGQAAAKPVLNLIRGLSELIPPFLEERFGRLAELGIDFGVDDQAKVSILEVNSKPGRSALGLIGDVDGARKAVEQPVLYAIFLLKQGTTNSA